MAPRKSVPKPASTRKRVVENNKNYLDQGTRTALSKVDYQALGRMIAGKSRDEGTKRRMAAKAGSEGPKRSTPARRGGGGTTRKK